MECKRIMIDNYEIMNGIDQLRIEMKFSVKNFTENIISARTYSRYLSGETNPSFETIYAFLRKLNVSLLDFTFFVYNHVETKNMDELTFRDAMRLDNYESSDESYQRMKSKKCKTAYSRKTIPVGLIYLDYKARRTHRSEAVQRMKDIIHFSSLMDSRIVDDDTVEALHIFVRMAEDQDKRVIADYLSKIIFSGDYKLFVLYYQQTQMLIYITALKALASMKEIGDQDRELMDRILQEALSYHIKARIKVLDFLLFEVLYQFIQQYHIHNPYIIYYYVTTILISTDPEIVKKKIALNKEDVDQYLACLKDQTFVEENMYERLLENGIFK